MALNEFEAEALYESVTSGNMLCRVSSGRQTNAVERSRRLAVSCCCSYPLFGVSLRSDLGRFG